jgi:Cytochrome P460
MPRARARLIGIIIAAGLAVVLGTVYIALSVASARGESASADQTTGSTGKAVPIFGISIQPGYRDWRLISVAHEEGKLNDLRAILGNDIAVETYRAGKLPFPDGAVIVRIAWSYVPSEENNRAFGQPQSFVAGAPTPAHLQFMVKDSKKYAATGGWGFAQFDKDGSPSAEASLETCFPCHKPASDRDFVFTHYSP